MHRLVTVILLLAVLVILGVANRATPEPPAAKPLFHADADHVWNRLHRHVYLRDSRDVSVDDREPLEPGVGAAVPFLMRAKTHKEALALLDEFLAVPAEKRIKDPLKRAVLQRDLWEAFASTMRGNEKITPEDRQRREEVQKRLVRAMRAVALSDREIEALPDNFADAVKAGTFAKEFDPKHPGKPFLPADLLAKDGPWVAVASASRADGLAAPAHLTASEGRGAFTVFLRLPEGRKATEAYVKQFKDGTLPELPEGAQTALVRRTLLIDDGGRPRESPLVESLQFRVYWKSDTGQPFAIRLRRGELLAGIDGGLAAADMKNHTCISCHARLEGNGVRTIATLYAGDPKKPGLVAADVTRQSAHAIDGAQSTAAWSLLEKMWMAEPSK